MASLSLATGAKLWSGVPRSARQLSPDPVTNAVGIGFMAMALLDGLNKIQVRLALNFGNRQQLFKVGKIIKFSVLHNSRIPGGVSR